MKTQTAIIEWHTTPIRTSGEYLIDRGQRFASQEFISERDLLLGFAEGSIKRWAEPIEYKTDEINAVELLEQAARELGGLIHLFNIRAKNDDVELLDFQTVDELQQLAVKITLNKLGQ